MCSHVWGMCVYVGLKLTSVSLNDSTLFIEAGSLTDPRTSNSRLVNLSWGSSAGIPGSYHACLAFMCILGDPTPGPHIHMANALSTEPSSQPR